MKEKLSFHWLKKFCPFCKPFALFPPQGSEQGLTAQEQALTAQQAAVINLTGVGGFTQSQAAGRYCPDFLLRSHCVNYLPFPPCKQ